MPKDGRGGDYSTLVNASLPTGCPDVCGAVYFNDVKGRYRLKVLFEREHDDASFTFLSTPIMMRWGSRRGLTRSMWTTGQNTALSSLRKDHVLRRRRRRRIRMMRSVLLRQCLLSSLRKDHVLRRRRRIRMMRSVLLRQCLQRCILRLRRLRRLPAAQLQRVSGFVFCAFFLFLSNTALSLRCTHRCPLVHACSIHAPRPFTFFVFG